MKNIQKGLSWAYCTENHYRTHNSKAMTILKPQIHRLSMALNNLQNTAYYDKQAFSLCPFFPIQAQKLNTRYDQSIHPIPGL